MKKFDKKSLENLSQEELIKLVLSLDEQNSESKLKIEELEILNKQEKKNKDQLLKKFEKKDEKFTALKSDYKKLNQEFDVLKRNFQEMEIAYNKLLKEYDKKNFTIKKFNHEKFCSKAENLNKTKIVINEAESKKPKGKPGRPKGSKNFEKIDLEALVTEVVYNEPKTKICEFCGDSLKKFDEDITYKIKRIPPKFEVIKVITPVYKCEKCNKIIQATSEHPFYHSPLTASFAANIIDAKYNLGVPLYRYSRYLNNHGMPISVPDLSNYILYTDRLLQPLYNKLLDSLIHTEANVIFADETSLRVLNLEDSKKFGYIFAYVTSFYDHPVYIYNFNMTRKTEKTKQLLENYKGYLVTDGYSGYDSIASENIIIQRCFAHIRRYFYDIVKTLNTKQKNESVASQMVSRIDNLFKLEEELKEKHLTPDEILQERHKDEYQKVVNDIYDFLHEIKAEPGTPLAKAVNYFKKVEKESKTFLLDGHIPISNNICERAIKPFTICRKNFLFSKTTNGANASARLFSIMQTARANGLVPELYLEYVINNILKIGSIDDICPWSEKIPNELKITL